MNRILEEYLVEIRQFLGDLDGADDILREIRSHILEKAREEASTEREAALTRAVRGYGSAREVAAKYLEDNPIIHPSYRGFLFRYTWLLFAVHFGLKVISLFSNLSFSLLPFELTIHVRTWPELLAQAPFTWIYDFGLVALVLYFITQNPGDIRLAWPRLFKRSFKPVKLKRHKPWTPWILLGLFLALSAVYFHTGSIFIANPGALIKPDPIDQPQIFRALSLLVLFILAMESATLFLRRRLQSLWVDFGNSCAYLVLFAWLLNVPWRWIVPDPRLDILAGPAAWVAGTIIVLLVWDLLRILNTIMKKR